MHFYFYLGQGLFIRMHYREVDKERKEKKTSTPQDANSQPWLCALPLSNNHNLRSFNGLVLGLLRFHKLLSAQTEDTYCGKKYVLLLKSSTDFSRVNEDPSYVNTMLDGSTYPG